MWMIDTGYNKAISMHCAKTCFRVAQQTPRKRTDCVGFDNVKKRHGILEKELISSSKERYQGFGMILTGSKTDLTKPNNNGFILEDMHHSVNDPNLLGSMANVGWVGN